MKLYPPVKIKNNIENKYTGHYEFNIGWKEGRENDQLCPGKRERELKWLSVRDVLISTVWDMVKNIARGLFNPVIKCVSYEW